MVRFALFFVPTLAAALVQTYLSPSWGWVMLLGVALTAYAAACAFYDETIKSMRLLGEARALLQLADRVQRDSSFNATHKQAQLRMQLTIETSKRMTAEEALAKLVAERRAWIDSQKFN